MMPELQPLIALEHSSRVHGEQPVGGFPWPMLFCDSVSQKDSLNYTIVRFLNGMREFV